MLRKFDLTVLFRLSMMVGIVALLAVVTLTAASADRGRDDDGKKSENSLTEVVYVCVNAKNGKMRAVESDEDCKKKEFAVSWGTSGGIGPVGPQGIQGEDGLDGLNGLDGLDGEQGPVGPTGADGAQGIQGDPGVSNLVNFSCGVGDVIVGFDGNGDPVCVSFTELLDNPPVIAFVPNRSVLETNTDSVVVSATDSDGDEITFTLDSSHSFVSITDGGTGDDTAIINFDPALNDAGFYLVTVRATSLTKSDAKQFLLEIVAGAPR